MKRLKPISLLNSAIPSSDLDTDGTLSANSDSKVPSQKATKTYSDNSLLNPISKIFLTQIQQLVSMRMENYIGMNPINVWQLRKLGMLHFKLVRKITG